MIERRAASRYARALLGLAESKKIMDPVDQGLENARVLVERHAEISHLLLNSTVPFAEKADFIRKIMPEGTPLLLLNFIQVLIKKKRFAELSGIQTEFRRLVEQKKGVREVEAISAVPLSGENERRLVETLKKKLNAQIRLIKTTDPRLVGGLVVRFDGQEINGSFRSKLDEMKQRLLQ